MTINLEASSSNTFCWHQREFNRICRILDGHGLVLLQGGRGLGKTHTLTRAARERDGKVIDGSLKKEARSRLIDFSSDTANLFLDDVDRLLTPDLGDSPERLQLILERLENIVLGRGESGAVMTTTLTGASLDERERLMGSVKEDWAKIWVDSVSGFFQRLDSERLDPWFSGWQIQFEADFSVLWKQVGKKTIPDEHFCKLWYTEVLSLTGRHPALTQAAIDFIQRMLEVSDRIVFEAQPIVRIALEDALSASSGIRRINSLIRDWRAAKPESVEVRAMEILEHIAVEGELGINAIEDLKARQLLRISGLCYQDDVTHRFIVPGALIRREVLGGTYSITVSSEAQNASVGWIRIVDGASSVRAEISGAPWQILDFLYSRREEDRYWAADELINETDLKTQKAIQNAIQRLQKALSDACAGLDACVANRRGAGYRFISLTKLTARKPG